jgi:hypothetical protein
MGKPTSQIIQTLVIPYQPVKYVVTNTEKIILVTHDYRYAISIAKIISKLDRPSRFYIKIGS